MSETPTVRPDRSLAALLAGSGTMLLWSTTAIANKIAVGYLDPMTAGVLRSLMAASAALLVALALRLPLPSGIAQRSLLVFSGLASFALWPTLLSIGIGRTTAGAASLIMAVTPVFTVLLGALVERRWPSRRWWYGGLLAVAGAVALIVGRGLDLVAAPGDASGNLLILLGTAICAAGYVAGAQVTPVIGAIATTFWGLAAALVGLLPAFLWLCSATAWREVPAAAWGSLVWMAALSSMTGYALWFFALGHGGIGRIGSLQFTLPLLTLMWAAIVLGEVLTPALIGCGLVVAAGTFLAQHAAGSDARAAAKVATQAPATSAPAAPDLAAGSPSREVT